LFLNAIRLGFLFGPPLFLSYFPIQELPRICALLGSWLVRGVLVFPAVFSGTVAPLVVFGGMLCGWIGRHLRGWPLLTGGKCRQAKYRDEH
jgi:hypothetical protein